MKITLERIHKYYNDLESDPKTDTNYMLRPLHEHIHVFNSILEHSIVETIPMHDYNELQQNTAKLMDFLNENFHDKLWQCHDVHFHNNFSHFVACPSTCLNEIGECLQRIIQERFRN